MAMGKTTCPTCGSLFQVDSSMVGQNVRCPWCGEEIYMEGVDEPQEAPDGVLHSPAPATALEATPANPPPPTPSQLDRFVADDDEPRGGSGGTAKSTSPGMYALFALVALLCAFLGYRTAVKSHRSTPIASQGSAAIQPLPSDSYDVADDTPAEAEPNDGGDGGVDLSADDTDTVADENLIAESADTAAEAAEPDETAPVESVAADDDTEKQDNGEDVFVDEPSVPFMLDAASLTEAYRDSGISIYKCRVALKDFEKAVATANAVAETNRANMAQIVAKYLKNGMAKAQAAGDLDHVVAFKKALDTADMGIEGDLEEIVKLRTAHDAQKSKIDNALLSAGTTAAKGLYGTLEWQKKDTTRKNEIEQAQKIAAFQKQIEDWLKKAKDAASAHTSTTIGGQRSVVAATEVRRLAAPPPQRRQVVREIKPVEPEARIYTIDARRKEGSSIGKANAGDTIEIQYAGGKWHRNGNEPVESPDDPGARDRNRCLLVKREAQNQNLVMAQLPANTKENPFQFTVEDDMGGDFALRIKESWGDQAQGAVRYSVKIIPGEASRVAGEATPSFSVVDDSWEHSVARQPSFPIPASAGSRQAQMWRRIQVDARAFKGTPFSAKAGDVITVKYVDGTWTYSPSVQKQNPDADRDVEDGNRCALADSLHPGDTLAVLPPNTKGEPFEYTAEKDGAFILRINDGGGESPYRDNRGFVTYMVSIVSALGGRASPRAVAAGDSHPPAGGFSNQTLTGTQTDVSVTLSKSPLPHVVKEQYLVPEGKELIVEAGATIVFEEGASLYCEGTLKMNGTERAPIICKGRMSRAEYWNGITVKSGSSEIASLRVRDAKTGLTCFHASPKIRDSVFCRNKVGIHFNNSSATFENCMVSDNEVDGISCAYSGTVRPHFTRCTFTGNGVTGVSCGYYGSPQLDSCLIAKNGKFGVHTYLYGCNVRANQCVIMDNKELDVSHNADPKLNFRQTYWGSSVTRILQQRGDGVNLPNIKDGRDSGGGNIVDIAEFLTEPPKDCGATVTW